MQHQDTSNMTYVCHSYVQRSRTVKSICKVKVSLRLKESWTKLDATQVLTTVYFQESFLALLPDSCYAPKRLREIHYACILTKKDTIICIIKLSVYLQICCSVFILYLRESDGGGGDNSADEAAGVKREL